jgi:cell pole-organizing protein PopZ
VDEGVDDVESDMTQPAKVQEPSMEEILASIRRIIADDEAKPIAAEPAPQAAKPEPPKPAPAPVPAAMTNIPPSAIPAAQAAVAKAAPPPAAKPAPAPPPPAAANGQDDIDALLAGLDAATTEDEIRPPAPDGDVFELTDDMALPDPEPEPAFQHVEPDDDLEFAEAVAATTERPRSPVFDPPSYDPPQAPQQQILSHSTVSAVESAFHTLANTVLSNNARTLEDLVKEMLRPMLKSWLDDNLPGLVERIVKAEIERVSRGGR